jgi:hypothetical protein
VNRTLRQVNTTWGRSTPSSKVNVNIGKPESVLGEDLNEFGNRRIEVSEYEIVT